MEKPQYFRLTRDVGTDSADTVVIDGKGRSLPEFLVRMCLTLPPTTTHVSVASLSKSDYQAGKKSKAAKQTVITDGPKEDGPKEEKSTKTKKKKRRK